MISLCAIRNGINIIKTYFGTIVNNIKNLLQINNKKVNKQAINVVYIYNKIWCLMCHYI